LCYTSVNLTKEREMKKILLGLVMTVLMIAGASAAVAVNASATNPNLVAICHYDHGGEPHTIYVAPNAVDAHLNSRGQGREHQGDYLGECVGQTTGTTTDVTTTDVTTTDVTTTDVTTTVETTSTTPTTPSGPGCVETGAGKDGEEGNDSCAPRTTTTSTSTGSLTETTPTETIPTTPTVTIPTTPTDPEVTPDPSPEEPTIEEELEDQERSNTEYEIAAGRDPERVHNASAASLPRTGIDVQWIILTGLILVAIGFGLRRGLYR
jgi:LPXTG-motif cell wall-anchored protein